MEATIRPSREKAIGLVISLAPEYAEFLTFFQGPGGWLRLPKQLIDIKNRLNIHNYPELYDDEKKINVALMFGLIGEEEFKKWNAEVSQMSSEEQLALVNELVDDSDLWDVSHFFPPEGEEAIARVKAEYEALSVEDRLIVDRRAQFFWSYFFAHFHNVLSVMIHGEKLTSLVSKTLAGDDQAFFKAVQVDRSLLTHQPYFVRRYREAAECGEAEFLKKIAYRQSNPTLRGKIRYPALYMVFALLETLNWLDDLKHEEVLDICDQAQLDHYQNRIEDVNYLTKRLIEYRRMQKTCGASMY